MKSWSQAAGVNQKDDSKGRFKEFWRQAVSRGDVPETISALRWTANNRTNAGSERSRSEERIQVQSQKSTNMLMTRSIVHTGDTEDRV